MNITSLVGLLRVHVRAHILCALVIAKVETGMIMSYKQRKSPCISLAKRVYTEQRRAEKSAQIAEIKVNLNLSLYLKVNSYLIVDVCFNLLLNRKKISLE